MNCLGKENNLNEKLTTSDYWDSCYKGRVSAPFDSGNWKSLVSVQIVNLIESLKLGGRKVCEVGGGDGEMLAYLSKRYPRSTFSIIDFSPVGCELARKRAKREGVSLNIHQADIFSPPKELIGHFDLLLSLGVVEHFTNLASIISAKKDLLKVGGMTLTLIPNFSSPIYSYLCKKWSISVYKDHIPHDMNSFLCGHKQAGLTPLDHGYLGAVEFGLLSAAMHGPERKSWFDRQFYLFLTRVSKFIHFMEYKTADFPTTRLLSPFMYVVSKKVQ